MIAGGLFSQFFLRERLSETEAWRGLAPDDADALATEFRILLRQFRRIVRPTETDTENDLVFPILERLGWSYFRQVSATKGRYRDIPDAVLFLSADAKTRAGGHADPTERYRHGAVIEESKAWDVPLGQAGTPEAGTPSSQIVRYLRSALSHADSRIRWGLLTNGRLWRLYWAGAPTKEEGYIEFDLQAALADRAPGPQPGGDELGWFRAFLLLFRRDAHTPGISGKCFLDEALEEGRRYEARITEALSRAVFDEVFPALVRSLAEQDTSRKPADPAWRAAIKEAALVLLFRLLFVLYAEDRDLLPIGHHGYRRYSLRAMRDNAARVHDDDLAVSDKATRWWDDLKSLFAAIDDGDASLGLPPYNGGLFSNRDHPVLDRVALPDKTLAHVVEALSREGEDGERHYINYRDLSVQQLGAVYERLLERDVALDQAGQVSLRPNAFARKNTGSYYTPDELVRLVIRRTAKVGRFFPTSCPFCCPRIRTARAEGR